MPDRNRSQLTEEQIAKLKAKVAEAMANDRQKLVFAFPFTGAVAMRLDLVPVRDKRVPTACTDAKRIYFDCGFYTKLSPKERAFVLAHEIWHCVMLHFARRGHRVSELWNVAADMEVNALLKSECRGRLLEPPDLALLPQPELAGKSAEEIYEALLKDGAGDKKNGGRCESDQEKSSQSGSCCGQFDKHVEVGLPGCGEEEADNVGGSSDQWGEKGIDPDFSPSVSPRAADEMREAVVAAAQQAERIAGKLPAGVKLLLDKVMKSEIDWREALAKFVTKTFGDVRQWLPPNRRYVHTGSYFQSRRGNEVKIVVAVDTSGSCLSDLPKFMAEIKGLVEQNGRYTVDLIQCDSAVSKHETFSDMGQPLDVDADFEIAGGGGTSFEPVFDFIAERGLAPDCLVYFTDGYGSAPEKAPPYPTLWVLTSDGLDGFCNWGEKVRFKDDCRHG